MTSGPVTRRELRGLSPLFRPAARLTTRETSVRCTSTDELQANDPNAMVL